MTGPSSPRSAARALAQTLQQTLIPPSPPLVPGLEVAAVYRPAGTGEEVGGDFYDVFQVAEDDWVVVLGDVCGKGVEAAVVTALVRYTIRASSVLAPDPASALADLDGVLLAHGSDRFCTVVLLRLRRREGAWTRPDGRGRAPAPAAQAGGDPRSRSGPRARWSGRSPTSTGRRPSWRWSPATSCCSTPTASPRGAAAE